ncbi:MAG: BON domain-containing protein [Desertifilum sp.]|nr:BON domain-containing protein [Desertifilum sp.]
MKKIFPVLLGGALLLGAVACTDGAQTSGNAPSNTNEVGEELQAQENLEDATSDTRQAQIESDERARQDRQGVVGNEGEVSDGDIESLVRNNLETNLPTSQLLVESEDGVVTVAGQVATQQDLERIETLTKEVRGVKSVQVNAQVGTPAAGQ